MDFKPMADRVLVRRAPTETKTSSGFYIPDTAGEKANEGTVMLVGPGRTTKDGLVIPIAEIQIGDDIMFTPGAGTNVKVNGEELIVLKEDEIIAIISQ